jgi:hypothetical protein
MAIKVISTDPHRSVVKQVVCRNCGATLEYTPADVMQKYVKDYGGGGDMEHTIVCPPCGKPVHVR